MKLKHTIIGMAAGAAMVPTANAVNQYTGTVIEAMEVLGATIELASCKPRRCTKKFTVDPVPAEDMAQQPLDLLYEQVKEGEGKVAVKKTTKKTSA